MADITFAVTAFAIIGGVAALLSIGIYATVLTRFFMANRRVRLASREHLVPYYRDGWRYGFATV
ncbi:hypothetical protein [Branchiibius sp. NY16-3462-2]|uniref:hypothetical protein n=1 Tax=Branchiibius sp. NY16-3462-2 TaxID=1807500 RepID=UPI000791B750|nr:hypothetical protein [Branchiibius sp. NY16-3462-2]KYH43017.1 hypothetical protein AZH51_06085 [Branchiibius sp. NY16-3462-2]